MSKEDEGMLGAEFKAARERMGLSITTTAALLSVSETTVKAWDRGRHRVPPGAAHEITLLSEYTHRCVDAVVAAAAAVEEPMVLAWHLTEDVPEGVARTLGAQWWRGVAAGAQERVPSLAIGYASELDVITGSRERTLALAITPAVLPSPR